MGIYAKYNLTKYAFQDKEPETYYSCDRFKVSCYDGYEEWEHSYDTWQNAITYYREKLDSLEDNEYLSISIIGLVFN